MLDLLLPQRSRRPAGAAGGSSAAAVARNCRVHRATALRALRRADRVAGRALPRVCGAAARLRSARAAVGYDAAARRLVHAWKERGLRRLACEAAQLVVERLPRPRCMRSPLSPPTAGDVSSVATTQPSGSRSSLPRPGSCRACRCSSGRAAAASAAARPPSAARSARCLPGKERGARKGREVIDDVYTNRRHRCGGRDHAPRGGRAARRGDRLRARPPPRLIGR